MCHLLCDRAPWRRAIEIQPRFKISCDELYSSLAKPTSTSKDRSVVCPHVAGEQPFASPFAIHYSLVTKYHDILGQPEIRANNLPSGETCRWRFWTANCFTRTKSQHWSFCNTKRTFQSRHFRLVEIVCVGVKLTARWIAIDQLIGRQSASCMTARRTAIDQLIGRQSESFSRT